MTGLAVLLSACNALLGIRELPDDSVTGSTSEGGVPADGGGSSGGDGAGGDGAIEEPPPGPPKWRLASSSAPARHSTAIAYDQNRQRIVLFGGWGGGMMNDTWEWDGTAWSERTLPEAPGRRYGFRMVHDAARGVVFLYGGTRGAAPDQWAWDGTRWREKTAATSPPSFQTLAMAYDSDRSLVVMFGGNHYPPDGGAVFMRNETWEWNGTDWAIHPTATSPAARRGHAMTYDAARKRVVVFGGKSGGAVMGDTWEYDGVDWKEREPIDFPAKRAGACMAFDPRRKLVVMFGGSSDTNSHKNHAETWHWDGTNWTQGPAGPPAVRSCAMAWDPARRGIVLTGGRPDGAADVASAETWIYE